MTGLDYIFDSEEYKDALKQNRAGNFTVTCLCLDNKTNEIRTTNGCFDLLYEAEMFAERLTIGCKDNGIEHIILINGDVYDGLMNSDNNEPNVGLSVEEYVTLSEEARKKLIISRTLENLERIFSERKE